MLKQLRPALVGVLAFTLLTGLLFPLAITGLGQTLFPRQAGGSLIERDGTAVGSALLGQRFTRPEFFHARPSVAGAGYDATVSGGTNLGPTSRKLIDETGALAKAYREENGLAATASLPADAVTRSGSGLDPHISPQNAALQIKRVAAARGVPETRVRALVAEHTAGRTLGLLGEPRVNVLELNVALERVAGR